MTEELGNYETSFFIMNVPTKADLEIRDMADEDFAIFFHEYIHFLQDIDYASVHFMEFPVVLNEFAVCAVSVAVAV